MQFISVKLRAGLGEGLEDGEGAEEVAGSGAFCGVDGGHGVPPCKRL